MRIEYAHNSASGDPSGRRNLTERLDGELDALLRRLRNGSKSERIAVAEELGRWGGSRAVNPLCELLREPDDDLRVAAAEALGGIGCERAIPHLVTALQTRCVGGSGYQQKKAGRIALVWIVLAFFGSAMLAAYLRLPIGGFAGVVIVPLLTGWNTLRQTRGRVFRAITSALERILEANPTPEVRSVLPELEALSSDRIQQDAETRRVLSAAREHIDTLTAHFKSLPLTSAPPAPEAATLPVPAQDAAPEAFNLPRASG